MSTRRPHPGIVELASRLGLPAVGDCVESIVSLCRDRVSGWLAEIGGIRSVQQLQELLCDRLSLTIEEFGSDEGLRALVSRYIGAGEPVFASLPVLFDDATFATLIRRRNGVRGNQDRFVAVIDCRGPKAHRRFFSRWHEIAHLLTLDAPPAEQPVHRSTSRHSAVERLMDVIAADIGFFEPLFRPVLHRELEGAAKLSFASINRVRERFAPEASFQATVFAALKRWDRPAIYLEIGLGLTSAEAKRFDDEPIPAKRPTPKLRVLKVVANEAWQATGVRLARNMEVPSSSIMHQLFFARDGGPHVACWERTEDLADWRRSDGRQLPSCPINVEARPGRLCVQALLQQA